jgi:hypothetical protein
MGTLDPQGMVTTLKVNRPLSKNEQQHRLRIKESCSNKPHYELSLIKLNSTYVECVDKWFSMRGWVAMGGGLGSILVAVLLISSVIDALQEWHPAAPPVILLSALVLAAAVYLVTRDAFTYTHYPIRFNRKNRQVYSFQRDGTVLKAGWDDIYWTIYGHDVTTKDGFVVGHVLAEDKKTVKATIALSLVEVISPVGEQDLKDHFEFFRRYMEEGPGPVLEAIKPVPLIMLPGIYKQRESWRFGWERLTLNMNGWPLVQLTFQVFFLPMSLFRWIVMRTSKIPQWPQWVEDECRIDSDDPWIRDERHAAK